MRCELRHRTRAAVPIPKDRWQGDTFIEADRQAYEVVWNGSRESPPLCGPIERRADTEPAKVHLRRRS